MLSSPEKEHTEQLRRRIRDYDAAYYGRGESLIPDHEYDLLYAELSRLERLHPDLITADSPTQRVGSDLVKNFPKVRHRVPMMSIDNTYSAHELEEWVERVHRLLPGEPVRFIGELKVDGVALSLHYAGSRLVQAVTRGDGSVGDEVTANIRTIRAIPLCIPEDSELEVRGEAYLEFRHFQRLNESLEESGQKPMQNPRNTTSGTLKLQNPAEVARRNLSFCAYSLVSRSPGHGHYEDLQRLSALGFPTVVHSQPLHTLPEILAFCEEWSSRRHTVPFPVDGVVLKVDDYGQRDRLGSTAKSPRWVIAYKYQPETAQTRVSEIDTQVGRTGVITPIARLEPVLLAGTTIRNATLHNYDEITRLDVRIGDTVEIEKGGEIIPKVLRVVLSNRPTQSVPVSPPPHCPSCGSAVARIEGEVALRCLNTSCPAQIFASLNHFVSRSAMNIENLGPALLRQLIERGWVRDPADLFVLTLEQLASLERMGEKSARNVLEALAKAKDNPLDKLIHGLGIRMVGAQAAKDLAASIQDISELYDMSVEELRARLEIKSPDPRMAHSIRMYFDREENRVLVERLRSGGVNTRGTGAIKTRGGPLSGKSFVLTGTLEHMSREEATRRIEEKGGRVGSSVGSRTDYVVAGEKPGSKLEKARRLGVPILNEEELVRLVGR